MKLIGVCRLGRDAEVRYAPSGDPVASFSAAYDYGKKEGDKRPTQWVTFTLWGKRAEALEQYMTKGRRVFIVASDVHLRSYEKRDGGQGASLEARVDDLQLLDGGEREEGAGDSRAPAPPARAPAPAPRPAAQKTGTGFDDMDDDIPF